MHSFSLDYAALRTWVLFGFRNLRASINGRILVARRSVVACLGDTSGASAVEFAIVLSPFLISVFFLFQMALSLFWIQSIEYSTQQAARAVRTGDVQAAGLTIEEFKEQKLCRYLVPGMNCNNLTVSVNRFAKTWSQARDIGSYVYIDKTRRSLVAAETNQANARYCPGGPGDMIFIDTIYRAPVFVPLFWPSSTVTRHDGRQAIVLRATAVVMNEPFATAGTQSC